MAHRKVTVLEGALLFAHSLTDNLFTYSVLLLLLCQSFFCNIFLSKTLKNTTAVFWHLMRHLYKLNFTFLILR